MGYTCRIKVNGKSHTKRYFVDFYDMIDGWCEKGFFNHSYQFDELAEAKIFTDKKQAELAQGNKDCGEHYGVIDSKSGREVYCTQQVSD